MALTDKIAFCTLADLKTALGITVSTYDSLLEGKILAASELIQKYLARPLRREVSRVEKVKGFGTPNLLVKLTPIESIASITNDGSTIDSDEYEITEDSTFIYRESGWEWSALPMQAISSPWPLVPGTERSTFTVTYTGGYYLPNDTTQSGTPLPYGIVEACLKFAAMLYLSKGRDTSIAAESVGAASVTLKSGQFDAPVMGLPSEIASMLSGYRRAV